MPRGRQCHYPRSLKRGAVASDRETGQVDGDEVGGNQQAVGVETRLEIVNEFIRARLTDRLAFLDLPWPLFSRVLCLRAGPRRKDYRPEGERNCKDRCWFSHVVLPGYRV